MATKPSFEEQWKGAFDEAEVTPPEHVWVGIDRHLANEQMADYKSQARVYRWVAAACLLLLTVSGVYYMTDNQGLTEQTVVERESGTKAVQDASDQSLEGSSAVPSTENLASKENTQIPVDKSPIKDQPFDTSPELDIKSQDPMNHAMVAPIIPDASKTPSAELKAQDRYLLAYADFGSLDGKSVSQKSTLSPWETDHLYGVPDYSAFSLDKPSDYELFAGVSIGAGGFDPGFGSSNDLLFDQGLDAAPGDFVPNEMLQAASIEATPASGSAYSAGLDMGKRVSERFVLSGGVRFDAFSSRIGEASIVQDQATSENFVLYAVAGNNSVNFDAADNVRNLNTQTTLNNEFRYISVPVQAGYILLDKKFNITFNSGFSTSFLVDSYIDAENNNIPLSNDFDTKNQYSQVYFNFLSSMTFGYQFLDHYLISVEPNYSQALSDFTTSANDEKGKPRRIGVSLGFKYKF